MGSNQDEVMEARLRKAARKAWKRLLKDINSEPACKAAYGYQYRR
jgi:hypothetical protein